MKLFYNMGVYVDEANSSLDVVLGGEFWLWMDWIRLAFIAVIKLTKLNPKIIPLITRQFISYPPYCTIPII